MYNDYKIKRFQSKMDIEEIKNQIRNRERKFRVKGLSEWEYFEIYEIYIRDERALGKNWETLTEYVGKRDKNGKEIYEGNIVKYLDDLENKEAIGVVIKLGDSFRIKKADKSSVKFYDNMGRLFSWSELEVIGNIFENPELI